MKIILLSLLSFFILRANLIGQINYDDYFLNEALRVDYRHSGSHDKEEFSLEELRKEPIWGGVRKNLIDPFDYGEYKFFVYDSASNELIFSRGYSTLFNEWQTTAEAKKIRKAFSETIRFPYPKNTVKVEIHSWNRQRELTKQFEFYVDPKNYFISPERTAVYDTLKIWGDGDPASNVDIVFLPEGYKIDQLESFKEDCEKMTEALFATPPFDKHKDKFNVWLVMAPSEEAGSDIPGQNIWKKTVLNSSFYTFDSERYVMTEDYKRVSDVASNAPYDQIYILVNTSKYGGGAIYNYYSMTAAKNSYTSQIMTHEFGHGFLGLADEYEGDVSYEEFYPLDVEPVEPNITTLINFESKWKDMLDEDTPIPTPETEEYKNVIGVFEGGGYSKKGIYRSEMDCLMRSLNTRYFCRVCERAVIDMINYYAE